jgi:2-keto-3-deoxy-L-rhamnonate aldolase RhmA
MEKFRALSLVQPHNLAKAIEQTLDLTSDSPKHLYGSIMALPHTVTARSVAVLGFDYIMIDALHTWVKTRDPLIPARLQEADFRAAQSMPNS